MTHTERLTLLRHGYEALRSAESELRARLVPASEDAPLLRVIREIMSLADRMEWVIRGPESGPDAEIWRDLEVAGLGDESSLQLLREVPDWLRPGTKVDVAALEAVRALLLRYRAGEFDPPPGWRLAADDLPAP